MSCGNILDPAKYWLHILLNQMCCFESIQELPPFWKIMYYILIVLSLKEKSAMMLGYWSKAFYCVTLGHQ